MDINNLIDVYNAQRNKISYLGLDLRMRHVKRGKKTAIAWGIHNKGFPNSVFKSFYGNVDTATFEMVQFLHLLTLPENFENKK